ncbi:TIGR03985 family CRISPR-associated protein [Crocosphaera sp. XPORK-15E]|uniref:TIGR03985 family CRISPR-associated protein n=1 Tax=Crocosphaera sp. XPORK-15E TaxID=3110247 RepID=UPI002B21D68C|nr:TIGR03985 family CRISPR-associated protein [Crocosphaera sp. XPORK-15E]MEA5537326.1 TIGR03985 family CRISPR-associated protein [Crocosphaera sp. XPORK-15E]
MPQKELFVRRSLYLVFDEFSDWLRDNFILSLEKRYYLTNPQIQQFLSRQPLDVSDKTLRNHFQAIASFQEPLIIKKNSGQGNYKKISQQKLESFLNPQELKTKHTIEDTFSMDFLPETISNIVELLFSKIEGQQRLFIHHNYIVSKDFRERADDRADQLKEIWKQRPIPPISIVYDSASINLKKSYIIYPVCLYYFQRAYYLCAFGQAPCCSHQEDTQWYNYRLERIEEIQALSWDNSQLPFSKTDILEQPERYHPRQIQHQLNRAFGFDFYQPESLMLLRFNPQFAAGYIENSFRHDTFEKIQEQAEIISLIKQASLPEKEERKMIKTITDYPDYAYYVLTYRQNDNNVIMRLRSWSPNVEVLLPWDLRERIKKDILETYKLYH